jgi:ATP-binding cassette subfamily B protein
LLPSSSSSKVRLQWLKLFQVAAYQLGDTIFSYPSNLVNSAELATSSEERSNHDDATIAPDSTSFYVVCQGTVRLLCQPNQSTQEATVLRLEAGETFGADCFLIQTALPYRAIAASSETQVACLTLEQLITFSQDCPPLKTQLVAQAQLRKRLIFFKTATDLRSQPSHQLRTWMPLLIEYKIQAGAQLATAAPASTGRFWLRQGAASCTKSSEDQVQSLPVGTSWGHPHPVDSDWVAETELETYCLPIEHWKIVTAFMPGLANVAESVPSADASDLSSATDPSSAALPFLASQRLVQPVYKAHPVADRGSQQPQSESQPPAANPAANTVVFPKPLNRRLLDALNQYPWIEQQSSSDCGAACLGMITKYWGKHIPLHVWREYAGVGRSGASLKNLAKAAEQVGFQTRPVRASFGRLVDQENPWIAHWDGNHYVVVYRVQGNRVAIADPALGRRSLTQQDFCAHWSGYALLLNPTERLRQLDAEQSASLGRYAQALLPYRSLILQIIAVSILIQIFGVVSPLFTQIILDKVVVQKSMATLNAFAIGLLIFGAWSIGLTAVRQYLLSYFSNRLDLTLISGFIHHALSLPLRFFESRRVGDIITRVQENQKIQRFLIGQVVLAWLNFLTGFVYLGLMLYYNWRLTLLILSLIPPIVLLTLASTPLLKRVSRQLFKESADQSSVLVEMLTGITTVKSNAAEREFRWLWEDHLVRQMNVRFRAQKLGIGLQSSSGLINSIGSTALLWYGASLVIQDQLTIGQFVAFNMMMGRIISPVIALANLWDEFQEVTISVERLNDVFEAHPEELSHQSLLSFPPLKGEVEFENVTFRYSDDEERNTLQNIAFQAAVGDTMAIVGRSGSGKSTLVKLLEGLYHPNQGRITVDGYDLRHTSLTSLRSQIGIVPQDCFLFSGTVIENITMHRQFALEQVVEAAKLAEAHAFIQSLPMGYNTQVGERGSTLSGGQRQRIAIARALLGKPRILVMDEATSSLDTESERRFQQNLAQISRDRTIFIIAHRLSTVRNADCILVLDRGIVVEQGTHNQLMEVQGQYYNLVQQQLNL